MTIAPFPTLARVGAAIRILAEVGLPAEWKLASQQQLVMLIDRTGRPLEQWTLGELLAIACQIRASADGPLEHSGFDDEAEVPV